MPLTREQFENASDARIITVDAPELGGDGKVCIRLMSVGDRDSYELLSLDAKNGVPVDFRSEILCRTLCDEKGHLLFAGEDGKDIIRRRSSDVMDRLWRAAMKHNALTEEEIRKIAGE
jgi:hypothetical protein